MGLGAFCGQCQVEKQASGGKVCHLESGLRMLSRPRSSGSSHSLTGYARELRYFMGFIFPGCQGNLNWIFHEEAIRSTKCIVITVGCC